MKLTKGILTVITTNSKVYEKWHFKETIKDDKKIITFIGVSAFGHVHEINATGNKPCKVIINNFPVSSAILNVFNTRLNVYEIKGTITLANSNIKCFGLDSCYSNRSKIITPNSSYSNVDFIKCNLNSDSTHHFNNKVFEQCKGNIHYLDNNANTLKNITVPSSGLQKGYRFLIADYDPSYAASTTCFKGYYFLLGGFLNNDKKHPIFYSDAFENGFLVWDPSFHNNHEYRLHLSSEEKEIFNHLDNVIKSFVMEDYVDFIKDGKLCDNTFDFNMYNQL